MATDSLNATIDGILAANNYHDYIIPSSGLPRPMRLYDDDTPDGDAPNENVSSSGSDSSGVHDTTTIKSDPLALVSAEGVEDLTNFTMARHIVPRIAAFWGLPDPTVSTSSLPITKLPIPVTTPTSALPVTPNNTTFGQFYHTPSSSSLGGMAPPQSPAALSPTSMSLLATVPPSPLSLGQHHIRSQLPDTSIISSTTATATTSTPVMTSPTTTTTGAGATVDGMSSDAVPMTPTSTVAPQTPVIHLDEKGKKKSCAICHAHKTKCDGMRPCSRCARYSPNNLVVGNKVFTCSFLCHVIGLDGVLSVQVQ
jgi:hypothetical protein